VRSQKVWTPFVVKRRILSNSTRRTKSDIDVDAGLEQRETVAR
jgi:hypothetical protein